MGRVTRSLQSRRVRGGSSDIRSFHIPDEKEGRSCPGALLAKLQRLVRLAKIEKQEISRGRL